MHRLAPGASARRLGVLAHHVGPTARLRSAPNLPTAAEASGSVGGAVSAEQRHQYDMDGYVVIRGLVSDEMVGRLLGATNSLTDLARSLGPDDSSSPLCNTARTAFGAAGDGVDFTRHNPDGHLHTKGQPWSISGVLHPDLPESAVFLEYYGSEKVRIHRCCSSPSHRLAVQ